MMGFYICKQLNFNENEKYFVNEFLVFQKLINTHS